MKKVALIILDGWGIGDGSKSDAIANANTPFVNSLYKNYPHSTLRTSGEDVGLPDGQMGNSEVGHLNIGAGRIVYQDLVLINKAIREKTIDTNETLVKAFDYAKQNNKAVHLMGLVSEGGVHSSQAHLHYLCDMAKAKGLQNVFIHAFMDGRDTDPKSGLGYLQNLENHLNPSSALPKGEGEPRAQIASVVGRYYAMDRDKRWERIKLAYDLLVKGEGAKTKNVLKAVEESYATNITDEFIKPIVSTDASGNPIAVIKENDVVICFNFRTDRCREITHVLTQQNMPEQGMNTLSLYYVTMTNYDSTFKNVHLVYDKDNLANTLGEVIAKKGKTQIRIAETEKYPHVTFFFSGGREKEFTGEKRIMVPSPKVATYDLQPEMSAVEATDAIVPELKKGETDFICLNFANIDMVGHTGVFPAIIKAIETVDSCLKRVVETGLQSGYSFIIIADHGNADFAINEDGSPNTAHSTNPVPCILIDQDFKKVKDGKLADIAPTILKLLNIEIPKEMTGEILV
ncbi:MAG: phosphoglycerate mutase (2,3-diphosphoglycerate-independent) [Bacteroidetes bacterium RIFCSPLOWO2_12_FULL_35_15]|nr:MAG: phosphoglycerate mutase (2,3-diphosphoglycerate-independent) [Bacteroidetes bacterium RIFCSPLOWO2_12_FULL_35_15]